MILNLVCSLHWLLPCDHFGIYNLHVDALGLGGPAVNHPFLIVFVQKPSQLKGRLVEIKAFNKNKVKWV